MAKVVWLKQSTLAVMMSKIKYETENHNMEINALILLQIGTRPWDKKMIRSPLGSGHKTRSRD